MENFDAREILEPITNSLQVIGQNLEFIERQSSKLVAIDSLPADGAYALQKMREEFRAHENDAHEEVSELKAMARKIRPEIEAQLRAGIKDQVRAAIKAQTKRQVDKQIVRYVPIPLDKQVADSKKRLCEAKIALANSEARAQNATLDMSCEYEPLAIILTDSGERSEYYPADLGSLFSYDVESLNALLRSYDLEENGSVQDRYMRFLEFIGATGVHLDEDFGVGS